jgi:hypothetical protein
MERQERKGNEADRAGLVQALAVGSTKSSPAIVLRRRSATSGAVVRVVARATTPNYSPPQRTM